MAAPKKSAFLAVTMASAVFLGLAAPSPAGAQDIRASVQAVARRTAAESLPPALGPWSQHSHVVSSISQAPLKSPRQSSAATKASIIALAVLGGFVGGAIAGGAIENAVAPCKCDDPGLNGSLIGAPVGAIVGGVLGLHFTR